MLHLEEEFYKEKNKCFIRNEKECWQRALFWFLAEPTFNHQLRRLLVHTLLLLRSSVPLELDLMVISAKGSSMST